MGALYILMGNVVDRANVERAAKKKDFSSDLLSTLWGSFLAGLVLCIHPHL